MKVALPLAIGLVAVVLRVLSSPDLSNDHFMHMAYAQQLLFGELPGRDFVDPGMPLAYVLSAGVQLLHKGPFSELVFSAVMLGIAAAVTCVAAHRLSGSWVLAAVLSLLEIAFQPRLYSYPKILVPAVAVVLIQRYLAAQSRSRLAMVGVWAAASTLLRHDYAVYVVAAVGCALLVAHWRAWRQLLEAAATFVVATVLALLPYLIYVQWAEGIGEHLRRSVEFGKADQHQLVFELPVGSLSEGLGRTNSIAILFYAGYALALLLAVQLWARRHEPREQRAAVAAVLGLLASYLAFMLRYPIDQRIPDMAAVLSLAAAAAAGGVLVAGSSRMGLAIWARATFATVTAILLAGTIGAVWVLAKVPEMIDKTGVHAGVRGLRETFQARAANSLDWPWSGIWPTRDFPPAIPYLDACTEPGDSLLITWRAPEYNFFARRRFAAGHAEFLAPRAFTTLADQAQMLAWLERHHVPIALINLATDEEFARTYPLIQAYLKANYTPAGQFTIYDDSEIVVAVRNGLHAAGTWGPEDWPCSFTSAAE
jgi:hypothetical protein